MDLLRIYLTMFFFNYSVFWPQITIVDKEQLRGVDPMFFWILILLTPFGTIVGLGFLINFPIQYVKSIYLQWLLFVNPRKALVRITKIIESLDRRKRYKEAVEIEKMKRSLEEALEKDERPRGRRRNY